MTKPILLVSDPDRSLVKLALALEESGYKVVESAPHEDPLAVFAQWQPELVFLSLLDDDSERVCEQLRGDPDGAIVPVIFVGTGDESVRSPADALGRGGDYYFEHPLDLQAVLAKVQTYLGSPGGGAQAEQRHDAPPVPVRSEPAATRRRPSSMPALPDIDWRLPATSDVTGLGLASAAEPLLAEILAREAELDGARKAVLEDRHAEAEQRRGGIERPAQEEVVGRRSADLESGHRSEARDRIAAEEPRRRVEPRPTSRLTEERERRPTVESLRRADEAVSARLGQPSERGRVVEARRRDAEAEARRKVDDTESRSSGGEPSESRLHEAMRRLRETESATPWNVGRPAARPSEEVDRQRFSPVGEAFDGADADFVSDDPDVGREAHPAAVDDAELTDGYEPSRGADELSVPSDLPATHARLHSELIPGQRPYHPFEPEHGVFSATDDIASVLADVFYQQVTGRLDFSSDGRQKSVFFEAGMPVDAYSGQVYDRIEEFLFREAKITRRQYQNVRIKRLRTPRQVAAYLVTEGFLKPHELFDVVRGHLRETVLGLLEWEEGTFQYVEEQASEDDRIVLDEDPRRLILEGVRRKYLMPRLMARLGSTTTLLGRVPESDLDVEALDLGAAELELLRLLDGTRSVDDLVLGAGLDPVCVCQLLVAMMALGHVEILVRGVSGMLGDGRSTDDDIDCARVRDKSEQVRECDYFEILGLPQSATSYEVAQSADRILREFHKDRFSDRIRSELATELEEIRIVVEDARTALSADDIRGAYARHLVS